MNRFVSDSAWIFTATFLDKICNLLIQAYLVRKLGIDSYGIYAAMCALGLLASTSLVWRSGEIAIQALESSSDGQKKEEQSQTLAFLVAYDMRLLGAGALILAPVLWLTAPLFNVDRMAWMLSGLCLVNIGHAAIRGIQTVQNRFFHMALHAIVSTITQVFLIIICASKWGAEGAVYGLLLSNFAKTIAGAIIEKFCAHTPLPSADAVIREIFSLSRAGRPIGSCSSSLLRGMLQQVIANGDTLAISIVSTSATVGLYKVARAGASVASTMISPIISVLRGRIVTAWSECNRQRLNKLMSYTLILCLAGMLVAIISSPAAAYIIAPASFGNELIVASILIGVGLVLYQGFNTIHLVFAILSRDEKTSIYLQIIMAALLLSMIFLTGHLGLKAVALATTMVYLAGTVIFARYSYASILSRKQEEPL
ncbi:MAG: hypothetical protein CVV42_05045 [Candidatus Riflebacteria bacterium HGW-Riflebacteria-2]|jgi:O-antigen/teichoic acid export membrane protein|nr:MAG: hypothetical protein CVV42_05045 [Candidatus Riflebacteria bacterium HGW-Riflebacteria-2]